VPRKELLAELVASKARLKIASLLSVRPRTLRELSDLTGITVQGVLKHISVLQRLGVIEERKIEGHGMSARKVYLVKGVQIGDYSFGDLVVVKVNQQDKPAVNPGNASERLRTLSQDMLIQKRRIRDETRRLGRMIDDLFDIESRLTGVVDGLGLKDEERLVVETAFTEETIEEAEDSLHRHYGLSDSRRAIERAFGKVRRIDRQETRHGHQ
jgi:predicted transcriptional regulator